MNRFRLEKPPQTEGNWTRRSSIAAGLAAGLSFEAAGQGPGPDALWPIKGPAQLRGAVIAQRRRRRDVDGDTFAPGSFGGGGPTIPAYGAAEFEALAKAGANLVVMSFPELWSVRAPYARVEPMAVQLQVQIERAAKAGLYVILGLRSGPGRSDYVFHREAQGAWFNKDLIVDSIWTRSEEQAAWGEMCVDVAKMIAHDRAIAGFNIMVEPDPNVGGVNRQGRALGAWTPEEYRSQVSHISDWRRISGDIAKNVRAAARDLPILISPPAFARTDFLSVMGVPPAPGTVWCVHDYEPRAYTHATRDERGLVDHVESDRAFKARLDAARRQGAPVFLGEFGASGAAFSRARYHANRIAACEAGGVSWAVFRWPTQHAGYEAGDAMFDVTTTNVRERGANEPRTIEVLKEAWARNGKRPRAG